MASALGAGLLAGPSGGPSCDAELAAHEAELTRLVPTLLESMNAASAEVNRLDQEVGQAQDKCQWLLSQCERLREDLSAGRKDLGGRASPFLQAAHDVGGALERVRAATCAYSAANSRHDLAKAHLRVTEAHFAKDGTQEPGGLELLVDATEQVVQAELERDRSAREHAQAIQEFAEARESITRLADEVAGRTWLGRSGLPWSGSQKRMSLKRLQLFQMELAQEQSRADSLAVKARVAKGTYKNSIRELDRISMSVHRARMEHRMDAAEAARGPEATSACHGSRSAAEDPDTDLPGIAEVFGDDTPLNVRRRGSQRARKAPAAAQREEPEVSPEPHDAKTLEEEEEEEETADGNPFA